ncbi:putative NAC domain-containing protein 72-like [Cocos nucifera]|uniref:Putative NAC domain-containing protein 72-like n=1 Tax=Cocos nucifera TaxID=13894 RepID=A0A8K0IGI6_COCNU|nr:putative NAC domain-containing protein 72-like [Cocos nucifera]KAG1358675.1 putative NAC domain-containing protein 72-like [Cocos nucifera]
MYPPLPEDSKVEALHPGWCFKPSEQQLTGYYLRRYDLGHKPSSLGAINEAINPYSFRPDQLPKVSENGSYYYKDSYMKISGRDARNRRTLDGSGYWKSTDGQKPIREDGRIVGYKRNLRFYLGPNHSNSTSTKWVMTEYTRVPDASHAPKAICVIRKTAGNQRNVISHQGTNQPLPPSDEAFDGNHVPSQSVAQATPCGPSDVGRGFSHSQLAVAFLTPPLPFTGSTETRPSSSHVISAVEPICTPPSDFFANVPEPFDLETSNISEFLEGIEADLHTNCSYSFEAELKEALGDSWIEEMLSQN